MNDEVEVRPVSVMRRNSKKYNKLLKSQAIRAHLNGAKFADVSKQFGPCEDTIRKWVAAYLAGLLTLPGLEPVAPRSLVKPAKVQSEESFVSLIGLLTGVWVPDAMNETLRGIKQRGPCQFKIEELP